MKPIVISALPYTFPNGATEYASFITKIFKCPMFLINDFGHKPYWVEDPYELVSDINPNEYDCTIMGSLFSDNYWPEYERILSKLPHPIICVVHERMDLLNSDYQFFWNTFAHHVDGFITNMRNESIWLDNKGYKYIELSVPYVPFRRDYGIVRTNTILSLGRILPEKGHRQVSVLAEAGYDVVIAGQAIRYQEYELYYKKLMGSGARLVPSPTTEEINTLAQQCKIFMSFLLSIDGETSVSYSALRAINGGCIPIVANHMRRYFDSMGIYALYNESSLGSIKDIESIFSDNYMSYKNEEPLLRIGDNWRDKLSKFVEELS